MIDNLSDLENDTVKKMKKHMSEGQQKNMADRESKDQEISRGAESERAYYKKATYRSIVKYIQFKYQ